MTMEQTGPEQSEYSPLEAEIAALKAEATRQAESWAKLVVIFEENAMVLRQALRRCGVDPDELLQATFPNRGKPLPTLLDEALEREGHADSERAVAEAKAEGEHLNELSRQRVAAKQHWTETVLCKVCGLTARVGEHATDYGRGHDFEPSS